jgi:hypothetical protein
MQKNHLRIHVYDVVLYAIDATAYASFSLYALVDIGRPDNPLLKSDVFNIVAKSEIICISVIITFRNHNLSTQPRSREQKTACVYNIN